MCVMRNYLTLKEIADALGVKETYAGQAFDPAMEKLVKVYRRHPRAILRMLMDAADEADAAQELTEQRRVESELSRRVAMKTGRANRSDLQPSLFPQ